MSEIEKKFEEFRAKYHENRMARGLFYHKDVTKEYLDQQDRFMKIGFEAGYKEATESLANEIWCAVTPLQAKLAEQKSDYDKLEARCKELEEENRILKAKLEKCKETLELLRDKAPWCECMDRAAIADNALKELDSITIDSIKRGEK